ncbi:MAG: PilZ domain-containing protein [Pseudohongiellaceae bacterium]|nr:PilZ domain-containing protein [Pseudohongiellaceae bacterium]
MGDTLDPKTDKPDEQSDNRRAFTRVFFDAETVISQGTKSWPVELIDISLHGLLVKDPGDMNLVANSKLEADIHLAGDLAIRMHLHIAHQEDDLIGLVCDDIDIDSMTHLRRLVELNTGDTGLLERELSALG